MKLFKPKLKIHNIARVVFVTALSFFMLIFNASTASAWSGVTGGATGPTGYTETMVPFSALTKNNNLIWRVDLYISSNADGKINKNSDVIGSSQLPRVGSLLCVPELFGSEWSSAKQFTYIQTNYTNEERDNFTGGYSTVTDGEGNITTKYILPTLSKFVPGADNYYSYTPDGTAQTVAIATTNDLSLFKGQFKSPTDFKSVQDILTKDTVKAASATNEIVKQLLDPNKGGSSFRTAVIGNVNAELREKAKSYTDNKFTEETFNRYFRPDSQYCMVEWAMVISPLYRIECNAPFYYYDIDGNTTFISGSHCVCLDAFWFAQWNETSKIIGALGSSSSGWFDYNGKPPHIAPSGEIQGALARSVGCISGANNAGAVASAVFCKEKVDTFLGIYTQQNNLSQYQWARLLVSDPSEYAKRGGISVFTTKIEAPTPKIYYHLYTYELDEQNPPAGYTVGTTYTPKDLLQFTPNLGTPTVTSFSRDYAPTDSEYYYIPASDPKATENNNVPVAANDKLLTGKGTCQISLVSYQHFVDTNCFPKTVQFILVLPLILT